MSRLNVGLAWKSPQSTFAGGRITYLGFYAGEPALHHTSRVDAAVAVVITRRALTIVAVASVAAFGGLFGVARATRPDAPQPRRAAAPVHVTMPTVGSLGDAAALPALRVRAPRKAAPPPAPAPKPRRRRPKPASRPAPSPPRPQPAPAPPPPRPAPRPRPPSGGGGGSFDDSG